MAIHFSQLADITGGQMINLYSDQELSTLIIDSRKPVNTYGSVFFAIRGPNRDGHDYIQSAYNSGIRQFVVGAEYTFDSELIGNCNVWAVPDTILALQQIAAHRRRQFDLKVVAITGSNGKTIVKEWLSQVLNKSFKVVKSPKSYNSQVGVPLSVWQIDSNDEVGVFEAGISQMAEMAALENILVPDLGIFTNIGPAHSEGFISIEQKVIEKLHLFKNCPRIIYCADLPQLAEIIEKKRSQFANSEFITWSMKGNLADYNFTVTDDAILLSKPDLSIKTDTKNLVALENLAHCVVAAHLLGVGVAQMEEAVGQLTPIEMRLELKKGNNGCYLVDDSYSNDLASLGIALSFAEQQIGFLEKTLILSDILQSGLEPADLYGKVRALIYSMKIGRLIGIGEAISGCKHLFDIPASFFSSTAEFLKATQDQKFENEAIIIKGARSFRFEQIVEVLQEKSHGTRLIVNLDAIVHNFNFYRGLTKPETKIMVMVKALAYGGGSFEIGSLLSYHKADYLAVAYVDEGIELRNKGIQTPIMVMNPSLDSVNLLSRFDLEPEIFSIDQLKTLAENVEHSSFKVHLKIDTGMNRLGFHEDHIDELVRILGENQSITVGSIFSHLAGSEDPELDNFTRDQFDRFQKISATIVAKIGYLPLLHLLNSSGISRFPEMQLDMVRLGIGLYGISPEQAIQDQLETVSTLQTTISQIRKINAGQTVGYGRAFTAEKDMTIATIAIGYADGFDRRFSSGVGKVLVKGEVATVVGNVCMDMSMIDITDIDALEGDTVTIFGDELPVTTLSKSIGAIPYEILSTVGSRVKRTFQTS